MDEPRDYLVLLEMRNRMWLVCDVITTELPETITQSHKLF